MAKLAKSSKINGFVIYRGPSMIDGQPIVAIATGLANRSNNEKTGAMVQTWIMREDISPTAALNTGDDSSVCGDCKYRGKVVDGKNVNRACYVTVWQAPLVVWKAHTDRNIYPEIDVNELSGLYFGSLFAGRTIRIGSYGDPAAVPVTVWRALISQAAGHTGYTHQWDMKGADGKRKFLELRDIVMASADSHQEMVKANMLGFRTFRVTGQDSRTVKAENEFVCPASKEMDYVSSCIKCKACGGNSSKHSKSVLITVHGAANKRHAHDAIMVAA